MSIWVVNTSPLVFLGNLGRLELLCYEGREVYISRAVAEEIAEKPDAAAQAVQAVCATSRWLALIVRHGLIRGIERTLYGGLQTNQCRDTSMVFGTSVFHPRIKSAMARCRPSRTRA